MSQLLEGRSEVVGGKAAELVQLRRAGFRVPEFVVSPSELSATIARLGFPLVVRSSATLEDSPRASFAGQFRSVLNLRTLGAVEQAIRDCRNSLHTDEVRAYCAKQGIDPDRLRMEVIVQRMVQPELAGVAFTVNPVTGAEQVVVEACEGLADQLLAGHESALPGDHPLLLKYSARIEEVARAIQRHFGAPQDIEFAIENGVVYILQSRPITRIGAPCGSGQWTNADFRDGGVSSTVCTPLMWSLYDFIWEDTLKGYLREIRLLDGDFQAGRMFYGRPYWNLGAVKECLAKLPGFVEREFDDDLSVEITYEGNGLCTPTTIRGLLRRVPTVLALRSFFRRQVRFDQRFLAGGFETLARQYEPIPREPEAAFRRLVERDYRTTESNYFRTLFAASLAKLDFKTSFPEADYSALVAALPPMRHMAPVRRTARIGRPRRGGRKRTGTRVSPPQPFRIGSPRTALGRRPSVRRTTAHTSAAIGGQGSGARISAGAPRGVVAAAALAAGEVQPHAGSSAIVRLAARGNARPFQPHVLPAAPLRAGNRRATRPGRRHLLHDVPGDLHRQPYAHRRPSRNVRGLPELRGAERNRGRIRQHGPAPANALRGIGASPGSARGVARVVREVREAMHVEEGAVLVCPFTDPGWTPVLDRVAGVVTETGGLLSHAAVICREYGIPAVLGVPAATRRIEEGAMIVVHGSEGYVDVE